MESKLQGLNVSNKIQESISSLVNFPTHLRLARKLNRPPMQGVHVVYPERGGGGGGFGLIFTDPNKY